MTPSNPKTTLFLLSPTAKPCGVEAFARELAEYWGKIGLERKLYATAGRPGDWLAIGKALADVEALAINVPLVAWKKVPLTPLVALILALLRGKERLLVLHEWADLDWRRRAILGVYALFASRLLFSSPSVRSQFLANAVMARFASRAYVVPIPSNIEPASLPRPSSFAARIEEQRAAGKLVIGHFGSIYPKKQSDFVLDILVELKRLGRPAFAVFIGSFVKGLDNVEEDFYAKVERLGLKDDLLVTGYVQDVEEIGALFQEPDCFVYRFAEGLTSRRGSVLACLLSGRPVIVNAPRDEHEFDHHRVYRRALEDHSLRLLANDASATDYAALLGEPASFDGQPAPQTFEQSWRDAASAVAASLDDAPSTLARSAAGSLRSRERSSRVGADVSR